MAQCVHYKGGGNMQNLVKEDFKNVKTKELPLAPVYAIPGVTKTAAKTLAQILGIVTIEQLAESEHFFAAREICLLADSRAKASDIKMMKANLSAQYQTKAPAKVAEAPIYALEGISRTGAARIKKDVKLQTVREMAEWQPYAAAQMIVSSTGAASAARKGRRVKASVLVASVCLLGIALLFIAFWPASGDPDSEYEADAFEADAAEISRPVEGTLEGLDPVDADIAAQTTEVPGYYEVQANETLTSISAKTLGDAARWREILDANRDTIEDENLIFPGQRLRIPE